MRPSWGRYTRTIAVATLTAALVAGTVAAAAGPGAAAPSAGEFSNGTAKATALVARFAPGVGSLSLAVTNGVAVSEVTNDLAEAQAQTMDLGLIGSSITAEQCDGDDPFVTPEQLPQPTRVDNRDGDVEAESTEYPVAGSTLGGGVEHVVATDTPMSHATATMARSVLGPVATINGGQADAVTEIIDGKAREARATVEASIDIAGAIKLENMRWTARHRTGADPDADASFTMSAASIGGAPLPVEDMTAVEEAVNTALAPSGISVSFPRVQRFTEPADLVRVTPLRIVVKDSPVGKLTVGAALNLTRTQREQLFDRLVAVYCRLASILLVGDITLSVLGGTGFFAIEVGGAEATTAELIFEDPFGGDGGVFPVTPPVPGIPGVAATPGSQVNAPGAGPAGPATQPTAATGPLEGRCESVHEFQWPPCSAGSAIPVGLLGLLATGLVGFLDWRHQRARVAPAVEAAS